MRCCLLSAAVSLTACAVFAADPAAGARKAEACVSCHGEAGRSSDAAFPSLAGQPPLYVYYQLLQFREERRKDPQMSPFAVGLKDADMQDIGAYFAAQTPAVPKGEKAAPSSPGAKLAELHHCASCHGVNFAGQNHIPRLAGQHSEYLLKQLRGFKNGSRPDIDGTMTSAAQPLSDQDMLELSRYLSALKP
jgi:cytochrome c553